MSRLKRAARALVLPVAHKAAQYGPLKRLMHVLLGQALRRRLRAMVVHGEPLPPRRMHVPLDSNDLSPATQAHYQELKRHFESRSS